MKLNLKQIMSTRYSYYRTVLLFLTRHCPLECRHCSIMAGPGYQEKMPIDDVESWMNDLRDVGTVELVAVSGGEPFSDLTLLSKVMACANQIGLMVVAITSGFWATDKKRAKRIIDSLPSFAALEISADEFHEPFVPFERIRFAAEAALERGTVVIIGLAHYKNPRFKSRLLKSLGKDLAGKVEFLETRVHHVGRAAQNNLVPVHLTRAIPEGTCKSLCAPVIRYDGNVMACCRDEYMDIPGHALWLGNLNEKRFPDMYREANENLLFQSLRTIGPKNMLRMAKRNGLNWKPRLYEKNNICDLCSDIVLSRDTCNEICDMLDTRAIRNEIATRRFLRFGEVMHN